MESSCSAYTPQDYAVSFATKWSIYPIDGNWNNDRKFTKKNYAVRRRDEEVSILNYKVLPACFFRIDTSLVRH